MVTLLGFFCILANVICLEIFVPDLVGPVGICKFSMSLVASRLFAVRDADSKYRPLRGYTLALHLGCGRK